MCRQVTFPPLNSSPLHRNFPVTCDGHVRGLVAPGTYAAYLDGERPLGAMIGDPARPNSPWSRRVAAIGTLAIVDSRETLVDLSTLDEGMVDFNGHIDLGPGIDSSCDSSGKGNVSLWIVDQVLNVCAGYFAGKIPPGLQEASMVVDQPGTLSRLYLPTEVSGPAIDAHLALPVVQFRVPIATLETVGFQSFETGRLTSMSWSVGSASASPTFGTLVAWVPERGIDRGSLFYRGWTADFTSYSRPAGGDLDPFAMTSVDVLVTVGGRTPTSEECQTLTLAERSSRGAVEADGLCHLRTLVPSKAQYAYRATVMSSSTGAMYTAGKLTALDNKFVVQVEVPSTASIRRPVELRALFSGADLPKGTSYEIGLVPIKPQQTGGIAVSGVDEQMNLYHRLPLVLRADDGAAIKAELPPWTYQASLRLLNAPYAGHFPRVTFTVK